MENNSISRSNIADHNADDARLSLERLAPQVALVVSALQQIGIIAKCKVCGGRGSVPPATAVPCGDCSGAGYVLKESKQ